MNKSAHCPMCDQPTVDAFAPFCSKRCADIDLGKWFTGDYALPSQEPLDEEAAEAVAEAWESGAG